MHNAQFSMFNAQLFSPKRFQLNFLSAFLVDPISFFQLSGYRFFFDTSNYASALCIMVEVSREHH